MKKKILFIIDSLNCGGAERSLISVLNVLPREKYEISLWCLHREGAFLSLVPNDVNLVTPSRNNFFFSLWLKVAGLCYSVVWRLNRLKGGKTWLAELLWDCKGRWMNIPEGSWDTVVAYQQGIPTFIVSEKFSGCKKCAWINADIFGGINRKKNFDFYSRIDKIVLVSDAIYHKAKEVFPDLAHKMAVVYDMLDTDEIRKLASSESPLSKKENELTFVTTARLVPEKGHDIAVDTAAELKRRGLKFKWYFIGEGRMRESIETQIKAKGVEDDVVLLGLQTNPYAYVNQADVYVQTSRFEGFGLTVKEAKLLSKFIVSTNFSAVYNQLSHEENGLIAEMNYMSVADNICRILYEDKLRLKIPEQLRLENTQTMINDVSKLEEVVG